MMLMKNDTQRIIKSICLLIFLTMNIHAQVKPTVMCVGGDNVPQLKQQFQTTLEIVLLEMNRINKGNGRIDSIKELFTNEAFETFKQFIVSNGAYTVRKEYRPQIIERQKGKFFDIRSITVKIHLGETEASDTQNLIFTFDKVGKIISVRCILPNYDYQSVIAGALNEKDSLIRGTILDFMERFRMAYNAKDAEFLAKIYSEEALIFVGSVLAEKKTPDDYLNKNPILSQSKIRLLQQSKREYIEGLKSKAFRLNSFINVTFNEFTILQHEKVSYMYGVSCMQAWRSSTYSDKGYLFLMIDFRDHNAPIIHVRAWQPAAFTEDDSYVSLYDFDIIDYK